MTNRTRRPGGAGRADPLSPQGSPKTLPCGASLAEPRGTVTAKGAEHLLPRVCGPAQESGCAPGPEPPDDERPGDC